MTASRTPTAKQHAVPEQLRNAVAPRAPHFVVVTPQGLGDTLEATPMFASLRAAVPHSRITAIVLRPQARELLEGLPGLVDHVVYLPYWELGASAFLRATLLRVPSLRRAEAAFLAYPAARPVYLGLLSLVPAKRRFAHRYTASLLRRAASAAIEQLPVRDAHNVIRNLDLLKSAGFSPGVPRRYEVPEAWRSSGARSESRIVMHVGTIAHDGLEARRWPERQFAELGRRLLRRGFDLTLLLGPAEREETLRVHYALPKSQLFEGALPDVARFISQSAGVIANDSGIAHLAAGCGTRVLAVHGPTPVEFGPYGEGAVAFRPSFCPPCFDVVRTDSRCKLNIDYACLTHDVSVDDVELRLVQLLAEAAP